LELHYVRIIRHKDGTFRNVIYKLGTRLSWYYLNRATSEQHRQVTLYFRLTQYINNPMFQRRHKKCATLNHILS